MTSTDRVKELSIEEIEADLATIEIDIELLQKVVDGLNGLLGRPDIGSQPILRADLYRYESALDAGKRIRDKILQAKETACKKISEL